MPDTFQLEIVTPDKLVVSDVAQELQVPGRSGHLGILPGHAPLLTEIAVGEITYRNSGGLHRLAVAWGFAEVLPDKVTILAETAEKSADIDLARAQRAEQSAQEQLKSAGSDSADHTAAQAALDRAKNRIEVAGKQ